jgi:glucuronate isomerase
MRPFLDEGFLLENPVAGVLYHEYAGQMPIIDYHCHINPSEICRNRRFENLTQAWLEGDHYKWRAMRSCGVPEELITGNADDYEKFKQYAIILPKLIGNPLYHWSHLELKRYLGIDVPLSGNTAEEIWKLSLERLPGLPVRSIIEGSKVEVVGTTDDPADSLEWHRALQDDPSCAVTVIPTFRPDKAVNIGKPGFAEYARALGTAANCPVDTLGGLKTALCRRMDFFVSLGCRASDHGFDSVVYRPAPEGAADGIYTRAMEGRTAGGEDAEIYSTDLMLFLGRELHKRGLVMQIHYGARRNANTRMFARLGADSGFDCIAAKEPAGLVCFLDALDRTDQLPKTILYSLNPNDNAMLGSVTGCFGNKLHHGSAWWFNDTKHGMEAQLTTLAGISALGNFIGMLTDSRSFLSYTRHEYFRRIFCNLLGRWVANGEIPNDMAALGQLVRDVSYNNAKRLFNL